MLWDIIIFLFSYIHIYVYMRFFLLFYMDVASYMRMETSWAIPRDPPRPSPEIKRAVLAAFVQL